MTRKEVKRLLREHPDFAAWLRQNPDKAAVVRAHPEGVHRLLQRWKAQGSSRQGLAAVDFEVLSQKTRRISEVLGNVQSIIDAMADYSKSRGKP